MVLLDMKVHFNFSLFQGSGIAQVAATSGQHVTLVDVDKKILDKSHNSIHVSLQRIAKKQFKVQFGFKATAISSFETLNQFQYLI